MVSLAQLVRASDCGSEGRGFDPHISPEIYPDCVTAVTQSFLLYLHTQMTVDKVDSDLKALLESEVRRYNTPEFITDDPVQFPRLYSDPRDIEITSLIVSTIAWGNRTMICRNASRMLAMMDHQPYRYVMDEAYEDLPDGNIHRTFFNRNLRHYLRGLHRVYSRHGSLEELARHAGAPAAEAPAWTIAAALNAELEAANGCTDSRCLPLGIDKTALKRFNMALRWLVRDDGIVDMGIWKAITPAQLRIPLDVHVANVSRGLGLLTRRSNDRTAVEELTARLREFCPDDPVKYDFALFGAGVNARAAAMAAE